MAGAAVEAMLKEPNALPSAKGKPAVCDGDGEGGAGETRLDMTGHIVGSLLGVADSGTAWVPDVWDDAIEMGLHIGKDVRVGILAYRAVIGDMNLGCVSGKVEVVRSSVGGIC